MKAKELAERKGFEPTVRLHAQRSRSSVNSVAWSSPSLGYLAGGAGAPIAAEFRFLDSRFLVRRRGAKKVCGRTIPTEPPLSDGVHEATSPHERPVLVTTWLRTHTSDYDLSGVHVATSINPTGDHSHRRSVRSIRAARLERQREADRARSRPSRSEFIPSMCAGQVRPNNPRSVSDWVRSVSDFWANSVSDDFEKSLILLNSFEPVPDLKSLGP